MKAKTIALLLGLSISLLMKPQATVLLNSCTGSPTLACSGNTLTIHNATVTPGSVVGVYFYINLTTPKIRSFEISEPNLGYKSLFISTALTGTLSTECPNYTAVSYTTPATYYNLLPPGTATIQTTPTFSLTPGLYIIYAEFYKFAGDTNTFYNFHMNLPVCGPVCPNPVSLAINYNTPSHGGCRSIEGPLVFSPPIGTDFITVNWDYGDGTTVSGFAGANHEYTVTGTHTITAAIHGPGTCETTFSTVINVNCGDIPCADCIESFAPMPAGTYIVSGWIKEDGAGPAVTSYTHSQIMVNYFTGTISSPIPTGTSLVASPKGMIIDGWQKVEETFTIPSGATIIQLLLKPNGVDAYYDDVRVFPFDGSMKGYVYDPRTMRLVAELDERNYATMYEYDEEGKLIRVKKETERGIMTIKESRNSAPIK